MLDHPDRLEADMLGAVGERHLRSPNFFIGSPFDVLEEVPVPDSHQGLPSLSTVTLLNERVPHMKSIRRDGKAFIRRELEIGPSE